ncbi:MAG TPA: outer membrane beta-barrel protein [Steroidobacteraceae bacterium]
MKKLVHAALLSAMVLSACPVVHAGDAVKRGGFLAQLDLDFGGDDLATLSFTNGESQNVKAGQGVAFGIGGYFRPVESVPFELQGILGYKVVLTAADNADIKVTRTTLQLNGIYRFASHWYVGAGYVQHMSPELDGDGFFEDIEFDDANGFNAEIGWKWVGLHYTSMDYSSDGYEDVDASHVGIRFTYRFGAN